jgi:hypothetical protein
MKRVVVISLVAAAMAAANPFMPLQISEFSADSSHQWVELHDPGGLQILDSGTLRTSTSLCSLDFAGNESTFAVIDSQTLAAGIHGHGTFRLKPDSDFLCLTYYLEPGHLWSESVAYPSLPAGVQSAPTPPQHYSVCVWNVDMDLGQCINHYIDSTPTPGDSNPHWCTVTGEVSTNPQDSATVSDVTVSGPMGCSWTNLAYGNDFAYCLGGLDPGRYWVSASGGGPKGSCAGVFPESIDLHCGQVLTDIDITLSPDGVQQQPEPRTMAGPRLSAAGPRVSLTCGEPVYADLGLFDASGRRRWTLTQGRVRGRYDFDISHSVGPGTYFARLVAGPYAKTVKVVLVR